MQNQENQQSNPPVADAKDPVAAIASATGKAVQGDFIQKIIDKIRRADNILIALPRDPSVDGLAAAIGLTLFLDSIQKHATAIYSGRTPNALKFLQPDDTFESTTDSLRDFIIALNKDKADHLRYKLEGDFVKVFITPYKTTITEEDLTFSHGDYNVDFVIAINVPSAGNLDEALKEHSRIMHDASVVNITTGQPGRFGEIEWSNPAASSLCEMITELIFAMQGEDGEKKLDKDVATALLSGIVAATDRFSNEHTNSDTMGIASQLMSMGADQRLISAHIEGNEVIHNEESDIDPTPMPPAAADKTHLAVDHDMPDPATNPFAGNNPAVQAAPDLNMTANPAPVNAVTATNNVTPESVIVQPIIPGQSSAPKLDASTLAIPGLAPSAPTPNAPALGNPAPSPDNPAPAIPSPAPQPSTLANNVAPPPVDQMQIPGVSPTPAPVVPNPVPTPPVAPAPAPEPSVPASTDARPMATSEPAPSTTRQVGSTIQPPAPSPKKPKNYAEMMEEALAEPLPMNNPMMSAQPQPAPMPMTAPAGATMGLPNMPAAPNMPPQAPAPMPTPPTVPAMELVSAPVNPVLPPPPNPMMNNGGMPPVLPPVQTPPGMV